MIATAEARDGEMLERIAAHRAERPAAWRTVEEPVALAARSRGLAADEFAIVDCLSLWVSNLLERSDAAAIERSRPRRPAAAAAARRRLRRGLERGRHGHRAGERARPLLPRRARPRERDLGRGRRTKRCSPSRDAYCAWSARERASWSARSRRSAEPDAAVGRAVQARLDLKTKPRGSLGGLERLAVRIASIQRTPSPALGTPVDRRVRGRPRRRRRGRERVPVVGDGADGRQLRRRRGRGERARPPRRRAARRRRLRRRRAPGRPGRARRRIGAGTASMLRGPR